MMQSSYEIVSKLNKTAQIGTDSGAGYIGYYWTQNSETSDTQKITDVQPAHLRYTQQDWRALALKSGKAQYVTDRVPREAYRGRLKFVNPNDESIPLSEIREKRLQKINRLYNIKQIHNEAVILARQLHRCGVIKLKTNFLNTKHARYKTPFYFKVIPIENNTIIYKYRDGQITEAIDYYNINLKLGRGSVRLKVPPDEIVLYINRVDAFSNGDDGIPETYASFDSLTWEANREQGWSETMESRGLSMVHMAIEDFEIDRLDEYRSIYGDLSTYKVLFTNEKVQTNNLAGSMANYDVSKDSATTASYVASATGIGQKRITGENNDITTDSSDSTDNHGAYLSQLHEYWEPNLINLFTMAFPDLENTFAITYDDKGKDDVLKRANIDANIANAMTVGMGVNTYNEVRKMAQLPPVPDGDVLGEIWKLKQYEKHNLIDQEQSNPDKEDSNPNNSKKYNEKGQKRPNPDSSTDKNSVRKTQRKSDTNLSENRGGVRNKTAKDELDISLHQAKINYIRVNCSHDDSYTTINNELKKIFGSGINTNDISTIKQELLKDARNKK